MTDISSLNPTQWQMLQLQNPSAKLNERLKHMSAEKGQKQSDSEALKNACADFEAMFISQMMKEMRNTIPKDGLCNGGRAEEIYTAMLDQKYADEVSKNGTLGLGSRLYDALSKNLAGDQNMVQKGDTEA